jgi:alpha-D-ribose 1-methylphosphonate 5-triphosphate diphosphatase PhnM
MNTQKFWTTVMDITQSDWMRFSMMTSHARKLEKENEELSAKIALMSSRRESLINLLMR